MDSVLEMVRDLLVLFSMTSILLVMLVHCDLKGTLKNMKQRLILTYYQKVELQYSYSNLSQEVAMVNILVHDPITIDALEQEPECFYSKERSFARIENSSWFFCSENKNRIEFVQNIFDEKYAFYLEKSFQSKVYQWTKIADLTLLFAMAISHMIYLLMSFDTRNSSQTNIDGDEQCAIAFHCHVLLTSKINIKIAKFSQFLWLNYVRMISNFYIFYFIFSTNYFKFIICRFISLVH